MSLRKLTKAECKDRPIKSSKGTAWFYAGLGTFDFYYYNGNDLTFTLSVPTASLRAALREIDAQRAPKRERVGR